MTQQQHPDGETLGRFARGECGTEERRWVVRHLLRGCRPCSGVLARLSGLSAEPAVVDDPAARYAEAYESALTGTRRRAAALTVDEAAAHPFVDLLLRQPRPRQALLLENSQRGRTLAVCDRLLAASFALRGEDPQRMAELAELAFRVAASVDGSAVGEGVAIDLKTRAAAELANALRVAGRIEPACRVISGAFQLLPHGSGDPTLRARVYELAASIFRHRRDLAGAMALLAKADGLYLRAGDRHSAGRVALSRAVIEWHRGAPEEALRLLVKAFDRIDFNRDRYLLWSAIHNMLASLVELGSLAAAEELLAECRPLYAELGGVTGRYRLSWLEGRIAGERGRWLEAEHKLRGAIRDFQGAGQSFDAALVQLDLAHLLARQGRAEEVRRLVEGLVVTFKAMEVERESIAALLVLQEALAAQQLPLRLLDSVRSFVRHCQVQAGLRFWHPARH